MADLRLLWAKSPAKGQSDGYPLLPHLLDVAAVASRLQKVIHCPVPMPCSPSWVAALAGFHDLGKATPGFQKKLGRESIPGYPFPAAPPDRHDASTIPLLVTHLVQQRVSRSDAKLLASAVGAHHGHLISPVDCQKAGCSANRLDPVWHKAHEQLFTQLLKGVDANGIPTLPPKGAQQSAFLQWLMGLTTVSDWIGSSEVLCRWDRLERWGNDPAKWFAESQQLAVKALSDVDLAAAPLPSVDSGDDAIRLALDGMRPRPLQQTMAKVIDQLGQEPGLVVIEAPMGEGKTEAGFSCAFGRRGLYVAMPTQATSNALMTRMAQFLHRATDGPVPLALAHGGGGPNAADMRLQEVGLGTADSGVTAGWWFRGSKRCLLCPQGIGTVDQALIGVLNARHGFVRLFGLAGRTVILDEVHAYDAYTGGLIERLVNWLQQLGCRVVLMSATLPRARRDSILRAWAGKDVPVPSGCYPRISWASPGSIKSLSFRANRRQSLSVQGIDPDVVTACAVAMAKSGARVLLVVNTVARAQDLYTAITGVECTLFHARFPMDERTVIEKKVLKQFGPGGSAQAGHVLVATQVAEQSLDIDMDVLITDPAPVDLVLQRAGRIHRHDRQRPGGFKEPLALVAGLDQEMPPDKLTKPIYDRWLVLRSHAWLRSHPLLDLPDDIDLAVQQVYGDWEPPESEEFGKALADTLSTHKIEQEKMTEQARQAALPKPCDWSMHQAASPIPDDEAESGALQFGTRLGQPSLTVIPVFPADRESLAERASKLAGRWLRISHPGLRDAVLKSREPTGWSKCPGLGHHHPLLLDADGVFLDGKLEARLDPELGLVIG
ncbi:MAG: CRISPR-associated helicase Cas3' [Cyanobacteria bacterium MAG CAR3_bin_5]|nr:CRISPR-associated helicase Cas3' [Cyanobacteria bacterium MAG CAR3_bin_5]